MKKITTQLLKTGALAVALIAGSASASIFQPTTAKSPQDADKAKTSSAIEMGRLIPGMKGMKKLSQKAPEDEVAVEELLFEDFSGFVPELADSVYLNEGVAQGDPFINPTYFHGQEGWWGQGVFSAGGACGLCYPGFGGYISTPNMQLYGNIHIQFKYKVQEGNTSNPMVIVGIGHGFDRMAQLVAYGAVQVSKDDWDKGWQDAELTLPSTYAEDDAWVQLNAAMYYKTGVLVDDLRITRDLDICGTPKDVWTYDYTRDGFSATWVPGAQNKSYLVNLTGWTPVSYDIEWHDISAATEEDPEGWSLENARIVELADGSKGIEMGAGSVVEMPANLATISDFMCYVTAPVANPESTLEFDIEGYYMGQWANLGGMYVFMMEEGFKNGINLGESISWFADNFETLRFKVKDLGMDPDAVDDTKIVMSDIAWSTNGWYDKFMAADNMPVEENKVTFTDLDMESLYFLSITGVNGSLLSKPTEEVQAIGVAAPDVLAATDIDFEKRRYTANWEAEAHADYGYTVSNFMMREIEEDNPEHIVMIDEFSGAEGDNAEDVSIEDNGDFNGYSDNYGWTTEPWYGIMNDGMIGTTYGGVLTSPYLTLDNNGGEYTVYFELMGWGEATLVVQNGVEYQKAQLNGEFNMITGKYDQDWIQVYMTFNGGGRHDRLEFYTLDGSSFLIGNFQVIQGVKKGDKVYECESSEFVGPDVTSYTFTSLDKPEGFKYDYAVQAHRIKGYGWYGEMLIATSNMSEDVVVDVESGVEEVEASAAIDRNAPAEVYTVSGVKVADSVSALPAGIYIVRQAGNAAKITVK